MTMKLVYSFFLAMALCSTQAYALGYTLQPPVGISRGEPGLALLECSHQVSCKEPLTLIISYPDGGQSPQYFGTRQAPRKAGHVESLGPSATATGPVQIMFLFSVPVDMRTGEASMVAFDADGLPLAGSRFNILDRHYAREDLWLDRGLTSLRVDPDPRKTEEAKRYQAVIGTADPTARYVDSGFEKPVASDRRTSEFGLLRRYLYSDGSKDLSMHNGIDYGCPIGTAVMASGGGRVVMAEYRIVTGNTIIIEHLPGTYTIYMHLDSMIVSIDMLVDKGETIGTVGMTGLATGPHLHWECRIMGIACDPEALIGIDKRPTIRRIDGAIDGR